MNIKNIDSFEDASENLPARESYLPQDRPDYDRFGEDMRRARGPLAKRFAEQILATTTPYRVLADRQLKILDVGSGYGHTALALAARVKEVVGIETSEFFHTRAEQLRAQFSVENIEFRHQNVLDLEDRATYDVVVLDNVLEHIRDQPTAIRRILEAMVPGGVMYLLTPNRLWPIEVHYRLPFLSYLPIGLANRYLHLTGRGKDFSDSSYAPSYWSLKRLLTNQPQLEFHFVLPANLSDIMGGSSWHYRLGAQIIRRINFTWAISKSFLVVGVKYGNVHS